MNEPDDFYLSEDELHPEPAQPAWEDVAAEDASVPRFGEI